MSSPKNWNWFFSRSLSSGSCLSSPPSAAMKRLVVQEVHLQPGERLALGVQREVRVVHAEMVEVEKRVVRLRVERLRLQRPGRHRDQRLVEVGGDPDLGGVGHRIERAALLVLEGLADAQVVERGVRLARVAAEDRAVGLDGDRGVGHALEESLAERVDARRAAAAEVQEHRPVGHGAIELGERGLPALEPDVRRARAHRGDESPDRHVAARAAGLEDREHFGHVGGELPLRDVVPGAIRQTHEVRMAFDEAWHHRGAPEIDDAPVAATVAVAHLREAPVADGHRRDDPIAVVHGVDPAVHQDEIAALLLPAPARPGLGCMRDGGGEPAAGDRHDAGRCADFEEVATRQTDASLVALAHGRLPLRNCGGLARESRARRRKRSGVRRRRKKSRPAGRAPAMRPFGRSIAGLIVPSSETVVVATCDVNRPYIQQHVPEVPPRHHVAPPPAAARISIF